MRIFFLIVTSLTLLSKKGFSEENPFFSVFYEEATRCHDISCIRQEINRINDQILILLTERSAYVQRAGDLKSKSGKIANDPRRVEDQENILLERAYHLGLPKEIMLPTFRALVEASILWQQKHIDSLTAE